MWITLSKNSQRRNHGNTLRLSVEKRGLSIRLNDQIAGAMGWSRGSRLGIKLGTEDHRGQIALYADPQGWSLQHAGTSSRKLRLMLAGTPVAGAPSRLPATNAEYRIDIEAKEVIVKLPWHKPHPLRGVQNAETGRYAHACPDLDQEIPGPDGSAVALSEAELATNSQAAQKMQPDGTTHRPFPRQDKTTADLPRGVPPGLRPLIDSPSGTLVTTRMDDVTRVTASVAAEPAPPPIATSMGDIVTFLRREGDVVVKSSKEGEWHLNGSKNVDAKFLVERANRIRRRKREPEMRIA